MKVVILMGGNSKERQVSLQSGNAIFGACKHIGYNTSIIDMTKDIDFYLNELKKYDLVFIGLHGGEGENGTIQKTLEQNEIIFTGSDSKSSALCMDKNLSKIKAKDIGIPTPKWDLIKKVSSLDFNMQKFPIIVKPNDQGSTVGLYLVEEIDNFKSSVEKSLEFSKKVILEEFISGKEITVPVLGDSALPIVEIKPKSGFYDYKSKYTKGLTDYVCPADIDEELTAKLKEYSIQIHKKFGCSHYSRVDFRIDNNNNPFFLEINTLPGMTDTSLVPISASSIGISFSSLVKKIIDLTLVSAR